MVEHLLASSRPRAMRNETRSVNTGVSTWLMWVRLPPRASGISLPTLSLVALLNPLFVNTRRMPVELHRRMRFTKYLSSRFLYDLALLNRGDFSPLLVFGSRKRSDVPLSRIIESEPL